MAMLDTARNNSFMLDTTLGSSPITSPKASMAAAVPQMDFVLDEDDFFMLTEETPPSPAVRTDTTKEKDYDSDDTWDSDDPGPQSSDDETDDETEPVPAVPAPVPVVPEPAPVVPEPVPMVPEPVPMVPEPVPVVPAPVPVVDETEEPESPEELAMSLCEQLASSLDTEVQVAAALANAVAICNALKKRKGIVKKNMARAANADKPRTKYGTNVPSAANLFAKAPENKAIATQWWEAGNRIPELSSKGRGPNLQKYLAIMWKNASADVRMHFKAQHEAMVVERA